MKIKKFSLNLSVALALLAFALMSFMTIATPVHTEAATAPYVQTTTQTINIPTQNCTSSGQTCTPVFTTSVTVLAGSFEVQFTPSSLHCSTLAASISVNGGAAQQTAFLAPGASSPFLSFGTVAAGTYTISVQGLGQVNGCNTGTLFNWMGAINVRANFPGSPTYNECLKDEGNGNLVRFNATTGAYEFTNCAGFIMSGVGTVQIKGSVITIQHSNNTRRLLIKLDRNTRRGTASLQTFEPPKEYLIADIDNTNNVCTCPTN
jgi:hypothetical protein